MDHDQASSGLFIAEHFDMTIGAPGHSYINPAEQCMSTLNLGFQNCSLSRVEIDNKQAKKNFSQKVRSCNSMDALWKQQPGVQAAWSRSIEPVRKLIESLFNRLVYSERR